MFSGNIDSRQYGVAVRCCVNVSTAVTPALQCVADSSCYCLSDGVGTDTPPQTPPNVKGQQGQQGQGAGLLGSGSFLGGSSSGSYGSNMGGLSSCSRGSTAPLSAQGVGGGASVGPEAALHQRYQGGNVSHAATHGTNTATSLSNTAFTPVYKKLVLVAFSVRQKNKNRDL